MCTREAPPVLTASFPTISRDKKKNPRPISHRRRRPLPNSWCDSARRVVSVVLRRLVAPARPTASPTPLVSLGGLLSSRRTALVPVVAAPGCPRRPALHPADCSGLRRLIPLLQFVLIDPSRACTLIAAPYLALCAPPSRPVSTSSPGLHGSLLGLMICGPRPRFLPLHWLTSRSCFICTHGFAEGSIHGIWFLIKEK